MSETSEIYFDRYAWKYDLFPEFQSPSDIEMVIVLPSYRETGIDIPVRSILSCNPVPCKVILLVVINESENDPDPVKEINSKTEAVLKGFEGNDNIILLSTRVTLLGRHAGVGLARKIGMDQACRWFNSASRTGIIACFDADSTCDPNYIQEIWVHYNKNPSNGAVVFYEHPLEDNGIVEYELHLRYYTDSLRYANYPFAFQTLGSCITVRSDIYMKQGGMNRRKAGEDFYFLHKVIPLGLFGEINSTGVYPAARISDRVPFGTGKALSQFNPDETYKTYSWKCFGIVKELVDAIPKLYHQGNVLFSVILQQFLDDHNFEDSLTKIRKNAADPVSFQKLFFAWFDGFRVLKLIHYLRDKHFPNEPLDENLTRVNNHFWKIPDFPISNEERLIAIRNWDREKEYSFPGFSV